MNVMSDSSKRFVRVRHPFARRIELPGDHRLVRRLGMNLPANQSVVLDRDPPVRRLVSAVVALALVLGAAYLWPVRFGGQSTLILVNGHSMEPTMHTGDIVILRRQPEYKAGDIAVFRVPAGQPGAGHPVVHRIIKVRPDGTFLFKGDNNNAFDPWDPTMQDVLGKRVLLVPKVGLLLFHLSQPLPVGLLVGLSVMASWWPRRRSRTGTSAALPRPFCLTVPEPAFTSCRPTGERSSGFFDRIPAQIHRRIQSWLGLDESR
jgi:signal peptidase I